VNIAAAFLVIYIFAWNMMSVSAFTMPSNARPIAYSLGIHQNWQMFAPPSRYTSWYLMVGTLRDGQQVELLHPVIQGEMALVEPIDWKQTEKIGKDYYKSVHWRLYLARMGPEGPTDALAAYVCRTWNGYHTSSTQVETLSYVFLIESILPTGELGEQRTQRYGPYSCG